MSEDYRNRIDRLIHKIQDGEELMPDDKQVLVFILEYTRDRDAFIEHPDTIE